MRVICAAHTMDDNSNSLTCSMCGVLGIVKADTPDEKHTTIAITEHLQLAHGATTARFRRDL